MTKLRLPFLLLLIYTVAAVPVRRPVEAARPPAWPPAAVRDDSAAIQAATEALSRGRPWRATRIMAAALERPGARSPEAVFVAARAAAAWGGWREVQRLLESEPWIDTLFQGKPRLLLARAALERGDAPLATVHSAAALGVVPGSERPLALVLHARALDRSDRPDSARLIYQDAARHLPTIADWLRLRAAALTPDSAARSLVYAELSNPLAIARVPRVEAEARARAGDRLGAARAFAAAGDRVGALRMRLEAAPDSARAGIRGELLELIAGQSGSAEARAAAEVLTVSGAPLSPHAMLVVARSLARSGPLPRAADFFRTALAAGVGTAEDRFAYANVLARLGRHAEAAKAFGAVRGDRSLAGRAAYLRVRSLVRGGLIANPRGELRRIVRRHPGDTAAAASALYLIADLAVDRGQDAEARATLRELARRYPTSPLAPEAGFRAAIIAYVEGRTAVAARELDSLRQRYPRSDEALAAAYWSGRAWHAAGDTARARARWESVAETAPLSYYAAASARRLGRPPWAPAPAEDRFPEVPAVEEGMARVRLLDSLGLDAESALEREALFTGADEDLDRLLATARAFREYGEVSRAVQLGWRALAAGAAPDARVYRLIYPIWHLDGILAEAGEAGLDPALVAALIRQESRFTPWATSRAGARGLMQLMPEVGRALAGRLEFPVWDEALLYVPDVSVELGTRQLATLARRYGEPERYLAAYNAGGSRVDRWVERAGTSDPELFVERIPYRETRDYVRVITRQRELYRALYQPLATASPGGD